MAKIEKMKVKEYADHLGVSRQYVYKLIKTGKVVFQPATKYHPIMIVTKWK